MLHQAVHSLHLCLHGLQIEGQSLQLARSRLEHTGVDLRLLEGLGLRTLMTRPLHMDGLEQVAARLDDIELGETALSLLHVGNGVQLVLYTKGKK